MHIWILFTIIYVNLEQCVNWFCQKMTKQPFSSPFYFGSIMCIAKHIFDSTIQRQIIQMSSSCFANSKITHIIRYGIFIWFRLVLISDQFNYSQFPYEGLKIVSLKLKFNCIVRYWPWKMKCRAWLWQWKWRKHSRANNRMMMMMKDNVMTGKGYNVWSENV